MMTFRGEGEMSAIRKSLKAARRRTRSGAYRRPTTRAARQEPIMATALAQPHRNGSYSSHRGYALGRLFDDGLIIEAQLNAGNRYAIVAIRYMRDITGTLPHFPSVMADRVGIGLHEPTPEQIEVIQLDWTNAMLALADTGQLEKSIWLLARICILDRDLDHARDIDALRSALNALHRLWT